jgi:predicted RNase H-like HicB family nuclease
MLWFLSPVAKLRMALHRSASSLRKAKSMSLMGLLGYERKSAETRHPLTLHGEFEQEDDGRWIAEITDLPGVMAYGATQEEAAEKAIALALRVLADRLEHGDMTAARGLSLDLCLQQ